MLEDSCQVRNFTFIEDVSQPSGLVRDWRGGGGGRALGMGLADWDGRRQKAILGFSSSSKEATT